MTVVDHYDDKMTSEDAMWSDHVFVSYVSFLYERLFLGKALIICLHSFSVATVGIGQCDLHRRCNKHTSATIINCVLYLTYDKFEGKIFSENYSEHFRE